MVKVAYILTPITFGGAEKVSLNFLRYVDRSRFDITLFMLLRPWEEDPYFVQEIKCLGYKYHVVPVSLKRGGDPLRVFRVAWRIFQLLRPGNFNVVHTHGYFADICTIASARLLRIKSITTCHGFIANDKKLKLYNKLDAYAIKPSAKVISVSDGIKSQLLEAGVREDKITVIPNAVEIDKDHNEQARKRDRKRNELRIADEDFVVGFLGRLSAEKGVNYLIDAVSLLNKSGLPVKLLIVGAGEERASLEVQVQDCGLRDRAIFAGFQTDAENWLPAFDVFALPSLTEGTPMALLEAMVARIPIVATAVGGVPKLIEDCVSGLLVEPADSNLLSNSIHELICDNDLKEKLIENSFSVVKAKYNVKHWCNKIESVYIGG